MASGYLAAIVLAAVVGLSLGALGSGGSIITIPLLVYLAHVPPSSAVGMSLVIVGATSFVGALLHMRRGNFAFKPGLLFALTGMAGSFLGSTGTHLLQRRVLMLLFCAVMLIVGREMWRGPAAFKCGKSFRVRQCLVAGFIVGLLTGFMGIGGGFMIVPALVLFAGLDTRMAAGTSLGVITFNCATGFLGQLRFAHMEWTLLSGFLAFAIAGMAVGATLSGRLPEIHLRRILATAIFLIGIAVGFGNILS